MGKKPEILKGHVKHDAKLANRHHPSDPATDPAAWARELTTQRVADLFKTLPGLPGHLKQIQDIINRGTKHFTSNIETSVVGKELFKYIAHAVVMAARDAKFDFPKLELSFPFDMAHLKISKEAGKLIIHSQP